MKHKGSSRKRSFPVRGRRLFPALLVGVVFFIVIMVAYSWLGGMRSVAYTDTIQGIALLFGVFMLLIGSLIYFGGPSAAAEVMRTETPEKLGAPDAGGIANWFSLLAIVGRPVSMSRGSSIQSTPR